MRKRSIVLLYLSIGKSDDFLVITGEMNYLFHANKIRIVLECNLCQDLKRRTTSQK